MLKQAKPKESIARKINVTSLRLFLRVLDVGTIAGAAVVENMVPAAVSKRVHDLEEFLGARLLSRTNKGIKATPAGEMLADLARGPLLSLDQIRWQLLSIAEMRHETVKIFASDSAISQFLPEAIKSFCIRHSNVQVLVKGATSEETVSALLSGNADIGIYLGNFNSSELTTSSSRRDRLVVICDSAHPIAHYDDIDFRDVLDREFIGSLNTGSIRLLMEHAAATAGRPLRSQVIVSTFEAQCAMVSTGMGIAVMPEAVARRHAATFGLKSVPLNDEWAFRKFTVATLATGSLSNAVTSFVKYLSEAEA